MQTSLDPSHLPFLGRRHEGRETGAALHRAAPPLRSDPRSALADADDDGDVLGHHRSARSRRRRQESKEQGLVPLPIPIPDLRFEQGYLLSLAPFLHVPDEPSVAQEEAPAPATDKEKREAVEEDTSFVQGEDAAKPSQSLYLNPRLQVEWRQVVYVTLRDQVCRHAALTSAPGSRLIRGRSSIRWSKARYGAPLRCCSASSGPTRAVARSSLDPRVHRNRPGRWSGRPGALGRGW